RRGQVKGRSWNATCCQSIAHACLISRQYGLTRRHPARTFRAVHAPAKSPDSHAFVPDSRQAWVRLLVVVLIASIGAVGMWSIVVVMPTVQAEFATTRGAISLATTMIFMGFGLGGVIMGRITDKVGIVAAMAVSIV